MDCHDVRVKLLDYQQGRLPPALGEEIRAHLAGCASCAHEAAAEQALTEVLEQRLPQHAAPLGLKRRLDAFWPGAAERTPSWWRRWGRPLVPALAVAAVLLVTLPLLYEHGLGPREDGRAMLTEAVNDHLRLLTSQHPLDIESGGMHQVKPWFAGRLDFAPVVTFLGDDEFPLQGGAVGYFLDRRAAVFVFHRRLHVITLLVFRADGLPWPKRSLASPGRPPALQTADRGFNVILWRSGELGYALVSDVDPSELSRLADRLAGAS
jgi:anti-sigma factor (TIGR02949 family)